MLVSPRSKARRAGPVEPDDPWVAGDVFLVEGRQEARLDVRPAAGAEGYHDLDGLAGVVGRLRARRRQAGRDDQDHYQSQCCSPHVPHLLVVTAAAAGVPSGQTDAGTSAIPSIRRRAVRRVTTFSAVHVPSRRSTLAPTSMIPAGWPIRTVRSPAGPGRAAARTSVPSTCAAPAGQIAPV